MASSGSDPSLHPEPDSLKQDSKSLSDQVHVEQGNAELQEDILTQSQFELGNTNTVVPRGGELNFTEMLGYERHVLGVDFGSAQSILDGPKTALALAVDTSRLQLIDQPALFSGYVHSVSAVVSNLEAASLDWIVSVYERVSLSFSFSFSVLYVLLRSVCITMCYPCVNGYIYHVYLSTGG